MYAQQPGVIRAESFILAMTFGYQGKRRVLIPAAAHTFERCAQAPGSIKPTAQRRPVIRRADFPTAPGSLSEMWMSSKRFWFVRPTRQESEAGLPGLAPAHGDCCAC